MTSYDDSADAMRWLMTAVLPHDTHTFCETAPGVYTHTFTFAGGPGVYTHTFFTRGDYAVKQLCGSRRRPKRTIRRQMQLMRARVKRGL